MAAKAGALPYEPKPFPMSGAIDADGHVCEPPNLWEEYLESKYKSRGPHLKKDAEGCEFLESDGTPVPTTLGGKVAMFHAMGDTDVTPGPHRTWLGNMPYGGGDATERVDLMNRENLEQALVYPTLSLCWEWVTPDPEISLANVRAYNRWIADLCRPTKGRLVPIAQLTILDVAGSVSELERAVKDGCKGAFLTMGSPSRKPHAHPDHDPIFAKAQTLDVPLAIHPSFNRAEYIMPRYDLDCWDPQYVFYADTLFFQMMQQALVGFFHYGTLERFPKLKLGILEGGSGWVASLLDRMDALYHHPFFKPPMKQKPSFYFNRQCFVSGDPDEPAATFIMDYVGSHCFMWGSDYPHPDHTGSWVPELLELAEKVNPQIYKQVLGENVKRIYKL